MWIETVLQKFFKIKKDHDITTFKFSTIVVNHLLCVIVKLEFVFLYYENMKKTNYLASIQMKINI